MKSHRCKDVLPVTPTAKCKRHVCKRPKGHAGRHECKSCAVTWLFQPKEPLHPFTDLDSPKDLGEDVFGPGNHFKPDVE